MKAYVYIVNDISLPVGSPVEEAYTAARDRLRRARVSLRDVKFSVYRKSVDARKKWDIRLVYSIAVDGISDEIPDSVCKDLRMARLQNASIFFEHGTQILENSPVVVGAGPCGLFAALLLAKNGYAPIVLERGGNVEERVALVDRFHRSQILDTETNVQFGAGGAGTFSDGKLVTRLNDPFISFVLSTLDIIITVDRLRRKIQFIKGTYFYKVVSVGKGLSGNIQPTNILTKDRLYRYCFKFYRKFISHSDHETLSSLLRVYYVLCILNELNQRGFTLDSSAKKSDKILRISREELNVSFEIYGKNAVVVRVNADGVPEASHLLIFAEDTNKVNVSSYNIGDFTTAEAISLWELFSIGDECEKTCASERSLVCSWLNSKLMTARIDRRIYEKYCPVCRARSVDHDGTVYRCNSCESEYSFIASNDLEKVWFRKIRK